MPVITLASSKGGVGKSTTALVLAQVITKRGMSATILDADPNQPIAKWAGRDPERVPSNLTVLPGINEDNILEAVDTAAERDPFVFIDPEGSRNMTLSYAIGRADFVLVPMRGSQLDADEAVAVVKLIKREERAVRRPIPYAILFTCTTAMRGRDVAHIEAQLRQNAIPMLPVGMTERAAFRAIFQLGGTIYDLTRADANKPEAAIENAEAVARALTEQLKARQAA